jgi:hypothetical protein
MNQKWRDEKHSPVPALYTGQFRSIPPFAPHYKDSLRAGAVHFYTVLQKSLWQRSRLAFRMKCAIGLDGLACRQLRDELWDLCGFWHRGFLVLCTNVGSKFFFTLGFVIHFHFIQ